MPRTNPKINAATLASVKKEMAQPRVAASARISEPPRVSLPGMVDEIIPANALQSEDGDAVGLKLGAKAEVIIEANSKSTAKK